MRNVTNRTQAINALEDSTVEIIDLDYQSGWQDAIELGRLTAARGKQARYRAQEHILVTSFAALDLGLRRPKETLRARHFYCQFSLSLEPSKNLERVERRAEALGDFVLAGHLRRQEPNATWE